MGLILSEQPFVAKQMEVLGGYQRKLHWLLQQWKTSSISLTHAAPTRVGSIAAFMGCHGQAI